MPELIVSGEHALLLLIKTGVILFLILYLVFAGVVIKQVRMMTDTLEVGFENPIKFIVLLHFIFALTTLVLAFILL